MRVHRICYITKSAGGDLGRIPENQRIVIHTWPPAFDHNCIWRSTTAVSFTLYRRYDSTRILRLGTNSRGLLGPPLALGKKWSIVERLQEHSPSSLAQVIRMVEWRSSTDTETRWIRFEVVLQVFGDLEIHCDYSSPRIRTPLGHSIIAYKGVTLIVTGFYIRRLSAMEHLMRGKSTLRYAKMEKIIVDI